MKLFKDCWVALLQLLDTLTLSPTHGSALQEPLGPPSHGPFPPHRGPGPVSPSKGPKFEPPGLGEERGNAIACDYEHLGPTWKSCSTPDDRSCWLKGPKGETYDLHTDYEKHYPQGILRKYYLEASDKEINADGVLNKGGKVFNNTYPGPWIQACWGDELEITVKNNLKWNGTTVHWHGIRQLDSLEMDGVNAVTQCPIAPGDSYTYRFKATQYGTSWYHSHYSLQYGDGMAGPLTIHGPASANYDKAIDPILVTDWNHRSGFQDFQTELDGNGPPAMDSILLNGIGSYAAIAKGGVKYNTTFVHGRKYLLRLINTSVDTTFIFTIDHHNLTVMTSDFVPIHNYTTDHVLVGIGQRYHVVVEARPREYTDGSEIKIPTQYWIRTIAAKNCESFVIGGTPDERQGILWYHNDTKAVPTSARLDFSLDCHDEPYKNLVPIIPWTVGPNGDSSSPKDNPFEVGIQLQPNLPRKGDAFFKWAIGNVSMFLNFSDPTIIDLDRKNWGETRVVIPKDYPPDSWVHLVITSNASVDQAIGRVFIPASHPIHLHGHDFAILQQTNQSFEPSAVNLNLNNPPRRDVVLLPSGGFVIIAFKADNPGVWLVHCHIAWHASSGLAMQIIERQETIAAEMTPARLSNVNHGCRKWNEWFNNPLNFWHDDGHPASIETFQDDSGI